LTANTGFNGCQKLKVSPDRLKGLSRRRIQFNPGIAAWLLDHPIRSTPSFIRRPSQPKQHWDFHQTERRLTSHRSGDMAQARKKGGLKFLYRSINDKGQRAIPS
jgi:hypothetical protein